MSTPRALRYASRQAAVDEAEATRLFEEEEMSTYMRVSTRPDQARLTRIESYAHDAVKSVDYDDGEAYDRAYKSAFDREYALEMRLYEGHLMAEAEEATDEFMDEAAGGLGEAEIDHVYEVVFAREYALIRARELDQERALERFLVMRSEAHAAASRESIYPRARMLAYVRTYKRAYEHVVSTDPELAALLPAP